jgi:hypothetical protein
VKENIKMKKCLIPLLTFLFLLLSTQVIMAEDDFDSSIVHTFFQKMSSGDVANIYSMLTDPLRSRMQILLRENKEYNKTLIRKYSKSRFVVDRVSTHPNGNKIVEVSVYDQNGNKRTHKFIIKRVGDKNWKISDEVIN